MPKTSIFKNTLFLMFLLNLVSSLVGFYIGCNTPFPDETSYLAMAEGLSKIKFSTWYFLDHYYPETLRMPGYPIFLFIVLSLFKSAFAVKIIQLFLYFFALFLSYKLVLQLGCYGRLSKHLFLSLTALNIQLPFYAGCISSEMLCIFLMVVCLYVFLQLENSSRKFVYLGLAFGALYYVRPAFLLLPFFASAMAIYLYRRVVLKRYILLTLLAFLVTTLPFVAWNHSNHGMMKLTPLEGGAGVAHMGYWSFKLPGNYAEKFYWGITVFPDITNPFTYTSEEYERNISAFESEWKGILKDIDKYLAPEDLKYIEIMKKEREVRPGMFVLYNSVYTSERELALWKALIRDVIDDPYFYLKTRVYTFFRLFFVGLNPDSLDNAETLQSKTKVIYPFLVTFVTVFAGFIFCTIYLMGFGKQVERSVMFIYSVVVFQGAIHVPFAIQSRFMVPVHFFIFIIVSILISRLKVFERYHLKSESSCALSH